MMQSNKDLPKQTVKAAAKSVASAGSVMWLVTIFIALVCLSLLVADVTRALDAREAKLQDSELAAANLARSLAQHAEDTVKEADTILVGLVERLETDGMGRAQMGRLRSLLTTQVAELPKLHGLFVYDENGRWLVNSQPSTIRSANNADRDYFLYHRAHPDRAPFIGKPVRSRSTGEWIVTVSRRLNRPDGSFAGVVLATIHVSYFQKFYDTFEIGKAGSVTLLHTDGTLLVRRPFAESIIGSDLSGSLLFGTYLPQAAFGTYVSNKTTLDQQERIVSYHKLEPYPLVVAVSFPVADLLQPWRSTTFRHLAVTFLLAFGLGVIGWRLRSQIGLRLRAERELRAAQSELKDLNRELERMALQDGLTGLPNRRLFDLSLSEEFNRAVRSGEPLGLIMLDVDAFKQYNDHFGHLEGDNCLRKIAHAIKSCQSRPGDLAARYGGEEFAILLPQTDLAGTITVAERIRKAVLALGIPHVEALGGAVTVSCGAEARVLTSRELPSDLVQRADAALYEAKSAGRDQVVAASRLLKPAPADTPGE